MLPVLILGALGLVLVRTAFAPNPDPRVVLGDVLTGRGAGLAPAGTDFGSATAAIQAAAGRTFDVETAGQGLAQLRENLDRRFDSERAANDAGPGFIPPTTIRRNGRLIS